jgi:non-canonical purine NTP pyrophosphatase (RdgB/HAM1 family)
VTGDLAQRLRGAVLVTGNVHKAEEARRIAGFELETVTVDLPEIQSLSLEEVLEAKAQEAWERIRRPLVVDETGLDLACFGGFPGPLIKWMLQATGAAGIARAAAALGDTRATARCALLFTDGRRRIVAQGAVPGTLVAPRGQGGFGWDEIFLPAGEHETYAELTPERKDAIGHRGHAWRALKEQLEAEGS